MTRAGTALLVIDMQIALVDMAYHAREVLGCVGDLQRRARAADGEVVIGKTASDSFHRTSLQDELRRRAVKHLVVTGMQTEYCVDTTVRQAISLGFDVTLVADGHTTRDALLPAADAIRHHNSVLSSLAHPDHHVTVVAGRDVRFEEKP
ncbi:MAG TPA: isochorismatase family protein [Methylomirabilota bacterium]